MTTTNANKKAKTEENNNSIDNNNNEFEILRRYILDCPLISKKYNSPAIKAALNGIDQELKRRDRDLKLQKKFATKCSTGTNNDDNNKKISGERKRMEEQEEEEFMNEWQDVPPRDSIENERNKNGNNRNVLAGAKSTTKKNKQGADANLCSAAADDEDDDEEEVEIIDVSGVTSVLGKRLATIAVNSIAQFQQKAKSPLAAIAMALHAALRSDVLGFVCTGVPDPKGSSTSGFAKPVRALPKTQFLPQNWDERINNNVNKGSTALKLVLRYKKDGMGSVFLNVQQQQQQQNPSSTTTTASIESLQSKNVSVQVQIVPTGTQEPTNEGMVFPLDQHINLDSWNAALRGHDDSVPPSLHYKGLAVLLTNLTKTFDLGHINDTEEQQETYDDSNDNPRNKSNYKVDTAAFRNHQPPSGIPAVSPSMPFSQPLRPLVVDEPLPPSIAAPNFPSIPQQRPPGPLGGDFASDLLPGGLGVHNPLLRNGPGLPGGNGNIMGPNHPFFVGSGVSGGLGPAPAGGSQPRFDPFGPPGGPTEINSQFPGRGNILGGHGRGRGRMKRDPPPKPGGTGEPDNDLFLPPDNNMFM